MKNKIEKMLKEYTTRMDENKDWCSENQDKYEFQFFILYL